MSNTKYRINLYNNLYTEEELGMINIACTANRTYLQHLTAMLSSVFFNTKAQVTVYVLNNDFTNEDKILLVNLFESYNNVRFEFYTIDDQVLSGINVVAEHLTIQTLYRLLVAKLLPTNIDKVLYLDCDLIIESDIQELYSLDIEDYYVAATNELSYRLANLLELEDVRHYFNAGVMLINLKKWRDNDFWSVCRAFALANSEKIIYGDQDILNGVLRGKWKRFELKWNFTTNQVFRQHNYEYYFGEQEVHQSISHPSIIHYIGGMKPWYGFSTHPNRSRYFYYLDKVQYSYVKFPELEYLKKQSIILFGASVQGLTNLEKLRQFGVEAAYFCDNSNQKWEQNYYNVKVISPMEISNIPNTIVLITSMYHQEISKQLKELGMEENKDFCNVDEIWKLKIM